MAITLRTTTFANATTKNSRLTHSELDANFTSLMADSGSSLVGFLQSGSGAVARTVQEKLRDGEVSIKDFGALCDGSTNDAAAFQAAVNAIGNTSNTRRSGMTLVIPGPTVINSTITIEQKSFTLRGGGWGRLDDSTGRASLLRWGGSAGSPMLKLINCAGGMRIKDLAFKGLTTAKPSAAIELNQQASIINSSNFFENISIGSAGAGDDNGDQFTDGIVTTGLNANNAEQFFNHISISQCSGIGIHQAFQQNGNWDLNNITISQCGTGVKISATARGSLWTFNQNDIDIELPALDAGGNSVTPRVSIHRYFSEQSGRMLASAGSSEFTCYQGDFGISSSLNGDGKIVAQTQGNNWCRFELHDFVFQVLSAAPTPPFLSFKSSAGGGAPRHLIFDGVRGWNNLTGGVNGLDIPTQTNVDGALVYLRQIDTGQTGFKARIAQNDLNGAASRDFDITKYAVPYSAPSCRLYDDFLGPTLDANKWASLVGTDPQCVAAAIVAGTVGGMARAVTGDDVAGTMAVNGIQLHSGLNYQADKGGLKARFRVKISAITDICLFFGFTDQIAALEMPFTLAAGDVLTSNATDACGILFDTAADTDNLWGVGVANDVNATAQNFAVVPVAGTYESWEIEISSTGQVRFYRNGVQIGSTMSGATRTTIPLTPIVAAFSRAAASRNIDMDKIHVEQDE